MNVDGPPYFPADETRIARTPLDLRPGLVLRGTVRHLALLPARPEGMLDAEILAEALGSKADVGAIAVHLLLGTDAWDAEDPIAVLAAAVRVLSDPKVIELNEDGAAKVRRALDRIPDFMPGGAA